jgi:tetratricopeptide (TPR) repeat protein
MISTDTLNEDSPKSHPGLGQGELVEIEVLVSGVTFGPFNEAKTRERVAEGLLALTDKARLTNSDDWKTLEEVLAEMPSLPSAEPELAEETTPAETEPGSEVETAPEPAAALLAAQRTTAIIPPKPPAAPATASSTLRLDGRLRAPARPGTGPLPAPVRKTSSLSKSPKAGLLPISPLRPTGPVAKPTGGIRSQILARTSQEPLKVGTRTGTPRLAGRSVTSPLSFAPPRPPAAPAPAETPPPPEIFPTSRPKLEDEAEEPAPEIEDEAPPAEEPATEALEAEPEETPAAEPEPEPVTQSGQISPATRSISVAALASGSLPRPPAAVSPGAKPAEEDRPAADADAGVAIRIPARRTQVIKALPGAAVSQTKASGALKTGIGQPISFRPQVPSIGEGASKAFTSPLPPSARSASTRTPLPGATLASVAAPADPRPAVNPKRRGMGNASALAATTLLPTHAKGAPGAGPPPLGGAPALPPSESSSETFSPRKLPTSDADEFAESGTSLVETRRAALRQARLDRKRQIILYGAGGFIILTLLCAAVFHYIASSRPPEKAPPIITFPAPAPPAAKPTAISPTQNIKTPAVPTPPAVTTNQPAIDPKVLAHISQGQADEAKGDLDGAIGEFTQALLLDPTYALAFGYRAAAKQAKGDLDGAIADDDQLVTLEPENANAFCQRGFIKQANKDPDGAVADYTHAIALDPKSIIAFYNRGMIQEQKGQFDAAIADYNQALDINPKLPGAFYNRGNAKMDKLDLDGAIADYTSALEINPKIALASCNRGLAEQNLGNLDLAMSDYNQALLLDPRIAMAFYNRGLIKEQQNDLDGCIADSTKAIELDPTNAQAFYNRGVALQAKGNLDAAANDLRKFVEIAPKNIYADYARLYLWVINCEQSHKPEADQELSSRLETDWNAEPAQLPTKIANFLLDHISESELMAVASSPDPKKNQGQHCEVWYFDGIKKMLTGNKTGAIDCFHQCLSTGQKDFCEYILAEAQLQTLTPS